MCYCLQGRDDFEGECLEGNWENYFNFIMLILLFFF